MKVLLTGASGLLGRAIVRSMKDHCSLYACAFSRSNDNLHKLNLLNSNEVTQTIESVQPHFIIHAAAERSPDICENEHATTNAINIQATSHLAQCAKEIGATIIYISTDYVFDGIDTPYQTDDPTNPLNYYGSSKLKGEQAVYESGAKAIVLRVPVLYGPVEYIEESAITVITKYLINQEPARVDHWAIRYPALVDDIADALKNLILELAKNKITAPSTLHFSGPEALTKYEIAKIMGQLYKINTDHLTANPEAPSGAPRPYNCQLDDHLLSDLIELKKSNFTDSIKPLIQDFIKATN